MNRINLTIKVSTDLEIIDRCYGREISHGDFYCKTITVNENVSKTVSEAIRAISIRSNSWAKQKLAEHCNNMILSHSAFLLKERDLNECNLYYPHLTITV